MSRQRVKFQWCIPGRSGRRGFTLTELLIVIAVVGLLAALLLPALARARAQANRMTCLNNARQVGLAMLGYLGDNQETFPAATYGNLQPEDWIYYNGSGPPPTSGYFQVGGDPKDIKNSPIARYTGGFSTNLFRCPADRFLQQLDQNPAAVDEVLAANQLYRFSYSLSAGGRIGSGAAAAAQGMASDIFSPLPPVYFRASSINRPSTKIMIAEKRTGFEETTVVEINTSGLGSAWYWAGSSWAPEKLTGRHFGKGNQAFADGHVESVKPELGLMPEHCDPRQ